MRRLASILAVAFNLTTLPAVAKPCDGQKGPLKKLAHRLSRTTQRAGLNALADEASERARALKDPPAKSCAHYLAAGAHFFLSNHKIGGQLHAAEAVWHLLQSQALTPEAMKSTQAQARLKTAWQRVGVIEGWLDVKSHPVVVQIPASKTPITLSPADLTAWRAACGTSEACAQVVRYTLPPGEGYTLKLRPGQYRVSVEGRCGESQHVARIIGGELALPPPRECLIQLKPMFAKSPIEVFSVKDSAGRLVPLESLHGGMGTVTVEARGYHPEAVSLRDQQGEIAVRLKRCRVNLSVRVKPQDANIKGDGLGPWGKRRITATRAGYVPLKTTVDVAPPKDCSKAPTPVILVMDRRVSVQGRDPDGDIVFPSQLWLEGEPVNATGFGRPVGEYTYRATHPRFSAVVGRLKVAPCGAEPCAPHRLEIPFERVRSSIAKRERSNAPYVVMGLSGALLAGGLISGAAVLSTNQDIDEYSNKREMSYSIQELYDKRDDQVKAANALSLIGSVGLFIGYSWHLWEGN